MRFIIYLMGAVLMFIPKITMGYYVSFTDNSNKKIILSVKPKRIVSVSPTITEILAEIGAKDLLKGITYYDRYIIDGAKIVGGFLYPSTEKIEELKPDIVFVSKINAHNLSQLEKNNIKVILLSPNNLDSLFNTIEILSKIVDRREKGQKLIADIKRQIKHIKTKLKHIPAKKRLRVMRIMGRDTIMTPGVDSFQNMIISLAGGIPPRFQGPGKMVSVTEDEFIKFNPQVIYGCYGDKKLIEKIKKTPEYSSISAIKNNRVFIYPCSLTCRLSAHTGYFVSWLAADIYSEQFLNDKNWEYKDHKISEKSLKIDLDYIKKAAIIKSYVFDFINKTLLIQFKRPMYIVSSLEGPRGNITYVGNHYTPPPCWRITHYLGLEKSRNRIYKALNLDEKNSSLLFTGANMDNLAVATKEYKSLKVVVIATAGVESNAMRMSKDVGSYFEPGTINMIILSNAKLTKRAMTRAIITATEAKTAALNDLDIRSSYNPLKYQATGTGTDNIIVVQGDGEMVLHNAGGHSKLGELIARAVYDAVTEAISKQNKIIFNRNIFKRLKERYINIYDIIYKSPIIPTYKKNQYIKEMEGLLLTPEYASVFDEFLILSDQYENGRIYNLSMLRKLAKHIASSIAMNNNIKIKSYVNDKSIPLPIRICIDSMLSGISDKFNNIKHMSTNKSNLN